MAGTLQVGGTTLATHAGSALSIHSGVTFPAGHVIQINQSFSQASVARTGGKNSWASTHYKCTLPNLSLIHI